MSSQGLSKTRAEVKDLQRLRQLFLEAPDNEGLADYWQDESLLELYDFTYARRIGWKWNAVLDELVRRGWQPPSSISRWIDWGCGSGIASEMMLKHDGGFRTTEIVFTDRSQRAMQYAAKKLTALVKDCEMNTQAPENTLPTAQDLLLISHVLTELNPQQLTQLSEKIRNAGVILWVEPGTPFCADRLGHLRSELAEEFDIVAPCPHSQRCPLLANKNDWCHFFASPPAEIFHDTFWSQFAREMKIDLRSLPVSFILLQRKSSGNQFASVTREIKDRLIARPRFYKGYAKVMLCSGDGTFSEKQIQQRNFKKEFKDWQKNCFYVEFTNDPDCD